MKLGYFHYYLRKKRIRSKKRIPCNLKPLLAAFCGFHDVEWKKRFKTPDGEHAFLIRPKGSSVFALLATRDNDLLKAIDTDTLDYDDLSQHLKSNEKTVFAAYIAIGPEVIGVAATDRGPRSATLSYFINQLLFELGLGSYRIEFVPLGVAISRLNAKKLAFVSNVSIRLGIDNPLAKTIRDFFNSDDDELAAVEVILRPRRKQNMKDFFGDIADKLPADDLELFRIRAKAHLDEAATEYFIATQGHLADIIKAGTEASMLLQVAERFRQNTVLADKLEATKKGAFYDASALPDITRFGDSSAIGTYLLEHRDSGGVEHGDDTRQGSH